jgi:hypothetical protein
MSGETESNVSGWTVDTLKSHALAIIDCDRSTALVVQNDIHEALAVQERNLLRLMAEKDLRDAQRFEAQQKAVGDALLAAKEAVQTALQSAEKAVTKAEMAADKRFDGINELRGMANDLSLRFATIEALNGVRDKIDGINGLATKVTQIEARTAGMTAEKAAGQSQQNWGIGVGIGIVVVAVQTLLHFLPAVSVIPGK